MKLSQQAPANPQQVLGDHLVGQFIGIALCFFPPAGDHILAVENEPILNDEVEPPKRITCTSGWLA